MDWADMVDGLQVTNITTFGIIVLIKSRLFAAFLTKTDLKSAKSGFYTAK